MIRRAVVLLIALVSLLGGAACQAEEVDGVNKEIVRLSEYLDAERLDGLRIEHLGDNSAVITLLGGLEMARTGTFQAALVTGEGETPGVTVAFGELNRRELDADVNRRMEDTAVMFFALVDDAEEFSWVFPEGTVRPATGSLTRSEANALAGREVSLMGKDEAGLADLIAILDRRA